MPKSKSRGGKKKHRKRVENRNIEIKNEQNKMNKYKQEVFDNMLKEFEKQEKTKVLANQSAEESTDKIDGIDGPEI